MADFSDWSHENLVRFAAESQAEIVRINNQRAKELAAMDALMKEYALMANQFCVRPERHEAYRVAKGVIGA